MLSRGNCKILLHILNILLTNFVAQCYSTITAPQKGCKHKICRERLWFTNKHFNTGQVGKVSRSQQANNYRMGAWWSLSSQCWNTWKKWPIYSMYLWPIYSQISLYLLTCRRSLRKKGQNRSPASRILAYWAFCQRRVETQYMDGIIYKMHKAYFKYC